MGSPVEFGLVRHVFNGFEEIRTSFDLVAYLKSAPLLFPPLRERVLQSLQNKSVVATTGASIHGIYLTFCEDGKRLHLRPCDLGLPDMHQQMLLADLILGHGMPNTLRFDAPKDMKRTPSAMLVPDARCDETVALQFPVLRGSRFPLLKTCYGVVDLCFLVAVLATENERKHILQDLIRLEVQGIFANPIIYMSNVPLGCELLWAASFQGRKKFYDADPNVMDVGTAETGAILELRPLAVPPLEKSNTYDIGFLVFMSVFVCLVAWLILY